MCVRESENERERTIPSVSSVRLRDYRIGPLPFLPVLAARCFELVVALLLCSVDVAASLFAASRYSLLLLLPLASRSRISFPAAQLPEKLPVRCCRRRRRREPFGLKKKKKDPIAIL
ncbi:hypothetical protein M9H77_23070 [Catharanthus roseus]|uniref:Uncharacterized protein n=1 Tax=Catharanthus roseus TaxID=4058 RepID=A0ACC0ARW2_CATRO|nr:hypothetical protein M9H77_23070 [Catharanthus roseus]